MQTEILSSHQKWPTGPGGSLHAYDPVAPDLIPLISTAHFPLLPQTCTCSGSPHLNLGTTSVSSEPERSGLSFPPTCLTLPWTGLSSRLSLPVPRALLRSGCHHLELGVSPQPPSLCPSPGLPSSASWPLASDSPTDCPDRAPSQRKLAMPPLVFTAMTPWPDFQGPL